ncbi:MAG: SDR family oxidoreductase, partial [Alphaproteobacteria bacterium]|nr:SDR family oxidoreductase [Alphaproteobacteria bacterium]
NPAQAKQLQAIAAQSSGRVSVHALDVTRDASVAALKSAVGEQPIHVLVNNAGVMGSDPQSPLNMNYDEFAQVLAVNAVAPLRVTNAFLPNLEAARGTAVVISSLMGSFSFGEVQKTAYCVSKTAANRTFKLLAGELKPRGIAVAILSPGWVRTDMGGPDAALAVEDSVRGLLQQIGGWTMEKSGSFSNYAGQAQVW